MMIRNRIFIGLVLIFVLIVYSLLSAQPYLLWTLPGGLPLGNLLAAVGLCAASATGLCIHARCSVLWFIALLALLLSIVWLPVSIVQAGNLELNFSADSNSSNFYFSGLTLLMALFSLIIAISVFIVKLYRRSTHKK